MRHIYSSLFELEQHVQSCHLFGDALLKCQLNVLDVKLLFEVKQHAS